MAAISQIKFETDPEIPETTTTITDETPPPKTFPVPEPHFDTSVPPPIPTSTIPPPPPKDPINSDGYVCKPDVQTSAAVKKFPTSFSAAQKASLMADPNRKVKIKVTVMGEECLPDGSKMAVHRVEEIRVSPTDAAKFKNIHDPQEAMAFLRAAQERVAQQELDAKKASTATKGGRQIAMN